MLTWELNTMSLMSDSISAIIVAMAFGWGYRASDQRRWAVLHPACGGRQQSPIAIAARQAIPISIPAMELIGYQNPLPGPLTITNNGHSGMIKFYS